MLVRLAIPKREMCVKVIALAYRQSYLIKN